jgi:methionyl aminopeptidase
VGKTTIRAKVSIKTPEQLDLMREAGRIVAHTLARVEAAVEPGISTAALDGIAEQSIRAAGAIPSFKGYRGFPASLCTSINEEIVHGIPSASRVLRDGDVVKIDCGAIYQGWHGDAAITVMVGKRRNSTVRLVEATREALARGIDAVQEGGVLGDVGEAIERFARSRGYQVVREYCGHGVGRELHEEPPVHNYRAQGSDVRLVPGMVLAIEPMLNAGTWRTEASPDGWTVTTKDRKLSAHFEHTVAVTDAGPMILTLP